MRRRYGGGGCYSLCKGVSCYDLRRAIVKVVLVVVILEVVVVMLLVVVVVVNKRRATTFTFITTTMNSTKHKDKYCSLIITATLKQPSLSYQHYCTIAVNTIPSS